jgi:hypothetical protein
LEEKGKTEASGEKALHHSKRCEIEGRKFAIELLSMSNGCFVSISEGSSPRMGAISLCVKTERGVSSSTLIPDRRGGIFAGMVGELLAERCKGIVVTSLHLREELSVSHMKTLLNQVGDLFRGTGYSI